MSKWAIVYLVVLTANARASSSHSAALLHGSTLTRDPKKNIDYDRERVLIVVTQLESRGLLHGTPDIRATRHVNLPMVKKNCGNRGEQDERITAVGPFFANGAWGHLTTNFQKLCC